MQSVPKSLFEVRENARGRPKGMLTPLRQRALIELNSGDLTLAELARRCNLTHYRNARRVVNDLRDLGFFKPLRD